MKYQKTIQKSKPSQRMKNARKERPRDANVSSEIVVATAGATPETWIGEGAGNCNPKTTYRQEKL